MYYMLLYLMTEGVGNLFFLIRGMEEIFLVRKSNVCVNSFIVLGIYFFKI